MRDGDLEQVVTEGGGKHSDSERILKVQQIRFVVGMDMSCERKRGQRGRQGFHLLKRKVGLLLTERRLRGEQVFRSKISSDFGHVLFQMFILCPTTYKPGAYECGLSWRYPFEGQQYITDI